MSVLSYISGGGRKVLTAPARSIRCCCFRRPYSRPTFAPKPVLDLKHIAQNSALYEQNCVERNYGKCASYAARIAGLRNENVRIEKELRGPREKFKQLQQEIRRYQENCEGGQGGDVQGPSLLERAREKAKQLKDDLDACSGQIKQNLEEIEALALALPNLSSVHTPTGTQARVLDVVQNSDPTQLEGVTKSHVDIGAQLGVLNFTRAATSSGWGWYYLTHEGALLEQALVQYALLQLIKRGWQIVSPPSIVYSHIADACGFQPRDENGEQQVYAIEQTLDAEHNPERISHVLTGTSEISLAAMQANCNIDMRDLPLKTAAVTRCYRAEAGARGTNTKGLYRVHEFTKVEMFAWTMPGRHFDPATGAFDTSASTTPQSDDVFNEMLDIQRQTLIDLGLNFQILEMPTTDLGASATRKIDMEAFFPSRHERNGGWGEVTSTSICTDYQTRRLRTKYGREGSGNVGWPWTVNGTAMAVPRILAAILECNWDEENKYLNIPNALKPWMHGIETVKARKSSPPLRVFA